MTGEMLNKNIDAVKEINDITIRVMEDYPDTAADMRKIQKCIYTLTDMLETVFKDMIKMDVLLEKGISAD